MQEVRVESLEDLEAEATRFVHELKPQEAGATLVTLSGELGAGKTAFTKAVAKALGVEEHVTSPTFVIEKIYELPRETSSAGFARLAHIDAYRLDSGADLAALGFIDLMKDSRNLVLLEWPEMVADKLPQAAVKISIKTNPDGSRVISYKI